MLVEREGYLDFSSPYVCSLYMQDRWGFIRRASNPPNDFKSFLIDTFTVIDPKVLKGSFAVGVDKRLLVRAWQIEFYRAVCQVLTSSIHISPGIGAKFNSAGFVDFYVDDGRHWMIELLQNSERAQNHADRFKPTGTYGKMVQDVKESVIIDIRNPDLCNKPVFNGGNWIKRAHIRRREVEISFSFDKHTCIHKILFFFIVNRELSGTSLISKHMIT